MMREESAIKDDFTMHGRLSDLGRWQVTRFVREAASSLPPGSLVLDAGAGECVYRKYFTHCRYRAVDSAVGDSSWNYGLLDYVGDLDRLPIEDDTFDAVLCTQVLEHLARPKESVAELHRVLKPGGTLFLTAPMAHGEHQMPHDYFRFTSAGLEWLCKEAGFSTVQIAPFGGMFLRWAYELPAVMALFPRVRKDGRVTARGALLFPLKVAAKVTITLLQLLALQGDRFDRSRRFPFGWRLVAVK